MTKNLATTLVDSVVKSFDQLLLGVQQMRKYTVEKRKILSTQRDIKILIFCPTVSKKEPGKTPGILWLHGGGYATGMAKMAYFSFSLNPWTTMNPLLVEKHFSRKHGPNAYYGQKKKKD